MFDAGMNSLPMLRAYSVSPRSGSTMRIPQWAFANSAASAIESMNVLKVGREPVEMVAGRGADDGAGDGADRHAEMPTRTAAGNANGNERNADIGLRMAGGEGYS